MSLRILVVEDENDLRALIAEKLQERGYTVDNAANGQEALKAVMKNKPDVIVSDVIMPVMDGSQLLKAARDNELTRDIPFIILTARRAMRDYFEVMDVDYFLDKPFAMSDLTNAIEHVAKRKPGDPRQPLPGHEKDIRLQDEVMLGEKASRYDGEVHEDDAAAKIQERKATEAKKRQGLDDSGRKKILLLENDQGIYSALSELLIKKGFDVRVVVTLDDCREEASRSRPDLIILKNVRGGLNGEKMAIELKQGHGFQKTPIILYGSIGQCKMETSPDGTPRPKLILSREGAVMLQKIDDFLK